MEHLDLTNYTSIYLTPDRVDLETPGWIGHIPFAMFLVEYLRPHTIVELGTHTGNSFNAFVQAFVTYNIHGTCYAIDSWAGDEQAGYYGDDIFNALKTYHDQNYKGKSVLLRKLFDEALDDFEDNSIDLLHIDGCHTYEAVKHDFENWLPKVREGGVILFHDTQVQHRNFGVWKFFKEICHDHELHFEHEHSYGLGVWVKGVADDPVVRLIEALNNHPSLADLFAYLGYRTRFVKQKMLTGDRLVEYLRRPDHYAQIYVDQGNGFNETDSKRAPIAGPEAVINFDLTHFEKKLNLRFDPLNDISRIRIISSELTDAEDNNIEHELIPNAPFIIGSQYLFDNEDPQIRIEWETDLSPHNFSIHLVYESVGQDAYSESYHILGIKQRLSKYRLEVFEKELSQVQALRVELNETMVEMGNIQEATSKLQMDFSDVSQGFARLKSQHDSSTRNYGERLQQINEAFRTQEKRLAKVDELVEKLGNDLDTVVQWKAVIDGIQNDLVVFGEEMRDFVKAQRNEILELKHSQEAQRVRAEANLDTIHGDIAKSSQSVLEHTDRISEILSVNERSAQERHELHKALQARQNDINHLAAKLEALENRVDQTGWFSRLFGFKRENTSAGKPTRIGTMWRLFTEGLKRPGRLISMLSLRNMRTLMKAIKTEGPEHILNNFRHKLGTTDTNREKIYGQIAKPVSSESGAISSEEMADETFPLRIHVDYSNIIGNRLELGGWMLASKYISHYEIVDPVQNKVLGSGKLKVERGDVIEVFGNYPYVNNCGFNSKIGRLPSGDQIIIRAFHNEIEIGHLVQAVNRIAIDPELPVEDPYDVYVEVNRITPGLTNKFKEVVETFEFKPRFSVVIPVYNVDEKWLRKAVQSVRNQIYPHWQLCLADDHSTSTHVRPLLEEISKSDDRIDVVFRKENGRISAATNTALEIAQGDYVVFMDNDDEIAPDALYEMALKLQENKQIDIFYSDEDKINPEGKRFDPYFKPDWSPELLLSYNYFNHLTCIRKSIVDKVGGLRSEYDGAQDFDLILRCVEQADIIVHIPKVLYHWRSLPTSVAGSGDSKEASFNFFEKARLALKDALDRRELQAKPIYPESARKFKAAFYALEWPDTGPLVSIIIPTRNHQEDLKNCLDSIKSTTYKNYEILVLDNESDDPSTLKYLEKIDQEGKIRVLHIPNRGDRFSYAYINNEGVRQAKGELILLLNNDTSVINRGWLSAMVGYLSIPGVGAVGGKLLYPDETIQHAGIINGLYPHGYPNLPDHAFKGMGADEPGYAFYAQVARNYSGVTAACLLTSKSLYESLGGLDEVNLALAYNDVDFCLRIINNGKRIVYAPQALLYHHESKSRKDTLHIEEVAFFKEKYRDYQDAYYNCNLSDEKVFEVLPFRTIGSEMEMPEKPRILFMSHNLNLEGAPLQLMEIAEGLKERGCDVTFTAPLDGPMHDLLTNRDIDVIFHDDFMAKYARSNLRGALGQLGDQLNLEGFDLIVGNTLQMYYGIEMAAHHDVPALWVIHESVSAVEYYASLEPELMKTAIGAFSKTYATVFVAKCTRSLFLPQNGRQNMRVINNGMKRNEMEEYKRKMDVASCKEKYGWEDKKVVLNLGTICDRKGQRDFVKAALKCIAAGHGKDVVFVMVGARDRGETGVYLSEIKTLIAEASAEAFFHIESETPEVFPFFRAADLFVCSSYNESYPRVILEAMAFDLPILTTPVFGITEQVLEDVNALYFPAGNIASQESALIRLLSDDAMRERLAANSKYVLDLITTYQEMIDEYSTLVYGAWLSSYKNKVHA